MNHKMNVARAYILFVLSLLLPWFSYNPQVMGYCHGYGFLPWLALPMLVLAAGILCRAGKGPRIALCELGLLGMLAVLVWALGGWQQVSNIRSGFWLQEGLATARVGYWVSCALYLLLAVMTQVFLIKGQKAPSDS